MARFDASYYPEPSEKQSYLFSYTDGHWQRTGNAWHPGLFLQALFHRMTGQESNKGSSVDSPNNQQTPVQDDTEKYINKGRSEHQNSVQSNNTENRIDSENDDQKEGIENLTGAASHPSPKLNQETSVHPGRDISINEPTPNNDIIRTSGKPNTSNQSNPDGNNLPQNPSDPQIGSSNKDLGRPDKAGASLDRGLIDRATYRNLKDKETTESAIQISNRETRQSVTDAPDEPENVLLKQQVAEDHQAPVNSWEQRSSLPAAKTVDDSAISSSSTTTSDQPEPKKQWVINLMSLKDMELARQEVEKFARQGISATITLETVQGNPWYRVQIQGFASSKEALQYASEVEKKLQRKVWVLPQQNP